MNKKIAITLLFLFVSAGISFCEQYTMPTDEEIMSAISKYNLTQEQKTYVFNETKRQLQENINNEEFVKSLTEAAMQNRMQFDGTQTQGNSETGKQKSYSQNSHRATK